MNNIKEITDKYPWLFMVVPIVIVAFVAYFYLSGSHTQPNTDTTQTNSTQHLGSKNTTSQASNANQASSPQGSSFNILEFILRLFGGSTNTQNTTNTTTPSTINANPQSQQPGNSPTQSGTSTSNTTQSNSGSTTSQNNPTSQQNTQNTTTNTSSGDTGTNNVPIIFKTPDGGYQTYTPPDTPPVDITWSTYVNAADRYSIQYPSNWQVVKTEYNGHEGISVYAPGTDPSSPGTQFIGFGFASYYLLPQGSSEQSTYSYPITVDGINGTMYTQGVLGNGSVASVFQYASGSFGVGSSVSDPDFIYIYNYMLQSLDFGPQQ
jgi:hypothetical protein